MLLVDDVAFNLQVLVLQLESFNVKLNLIEAIKKFDNDERKILEEFQKNQETAKTIGFEYEVAHNGKAAV